jgi:hypothetical protein
MDYMALNPRRQNSSNYKKTKNRITSPHDNRYKEKEQVGDKYNRKRSAKAEGKRNGFANNTQLQQEVTAMKMIMSLGKL